MKFMEKATQLGYKAYSKEEIPVGAVIVRNNKIIASAYNKREKSQIATHHAEVLAIEKACKKMKSWRLDGCDLYVTLEPCPMCAGAIINSRIARVVFGCYDKKAGVYGSVMNLHDYPFNHYYEIEGGVLEQECASLLSDFFAKLRIRKQELKQSFNKNC